MAASGSVWQVIAAHGCHELVAVALFADRRRFTPLGLPEDSTRAPRGRHEVGVNVRRHRPRGIGHRYIGAPSPARHGPPPAKPRAGSSARRAGSRGMKLPCHGHPAIAFSPLLVRHAAGVAAFGLYAVSDLDKASRYGRQAMTG
jgi:hypothetical protein